VTADERGWDKVRVFRESGRNAMSDGTGQGAAGPGPGQGRHRRAGDRRCKLTLFALIGIFLCLGGYDLISTPLSGQVAADSTAATKTNSPGARPPAASTSPASPASSVRASTTPAPQALAVASVTAFGPEGTSDGDHQGLVSRIDGGGSQPWYSAWYATAQFGNLQSGTGLLLDMGQTVTVGRVRVVLGSSSGADVQILVGNSAVRADMISVGGAADVGGTVRLSAVAASGRYVLVWFTRLPLDTPGKYQVAVYDVTVDGTP
jgi:hypothetical protein